MNSRYYPQHWPWILTANFGEGLPYAIVNILMVALLDDMGMSNASVAAVTALLSLPWALKAFWSPFVDNISTKRRWMIAMQIILALVFVITASSLHLSLWQEITIVCAVLAAFASATYDIACDGFYMKALPSDAQSFFVGIRSTAYRLGWLFATGGLVWFAGYLEQNQGVTNIGSWKWTFYLIAGVMLLLSLVHRYILPSVEEEDVYMTYEEAEKAKSKINPLVSYWDTVKTFFTNRSVNDLIFMLLFLFTYRLGEAFLSKVTILFLKDTSENGGLGLNNEQYGLIYGTVGILALVIGGILGGIFISRFSLRKSIILMAIALNLPDLLYVYMAVTQLDSLQLIGSFVAIEQFGYGFGFTAYTVFLLQCAKGQYETAHYAFLTALMAIGMAIPTMISGHWQENIGYTEFFIRACWLTLPGFAMSIWYVIRNRKNPSNS